MYQVKKMSHKSAAHLKDGIHKVSELSLTVIGEWSVGEYWLKIINTASIWWTEVLQRSIRHILTSLWWAVVMPYANSNDNFVM